MGPGGRKGGARVPRGVSGQSSMEYALVVMALISMLLAFASLWHAGSGGALLTRAVAASSHQLGGGDPLGSARDLALY